MKHINLYIAAAILCLAPFATQAQTASIQSKADYENVKASINTIAQKLYGYAKQYPGYTFSAEYNAAGKVIAMPVAGVSKESDAKQISAYLLEMENLGELARNVNPKYLTVTKSDNITENEASKYEPVFANTGDVMSSTKRK